MQDVSLAKANGQSEQLCGLSKLSDNVLEITLCVGHECTIISQVSFKNGPLDCLCLGSQATQVKEGSIMSVLQLHALLQIFQCVVEDAGEEKVEQHWSRDAPLLYANGDVKSSRGCTVGQHFSCHVVVKQTDDLDELSGRTKFR